jgi:CHAD domain-containing protein
MPKAADSPGFALGVLSRAWSRVEAGDGDALHRSRVATRRLREALPLVKGRGRERRRLRRDLRRITRALGPVRELDVALALAGTLATDWPDLAPALDQISARLLELRARRRARLVKKVSRAEVDDLVERVEALLAQAQRRGGSRPSIDRPRLAERIASRAATTREAAESAGALYAPEALHAVRIATKKLRYALEVARAVRIAGAAGAARRLRHYQDLLGLLHDLQVFSSHVTRVQARPAGADPHLATLSDLLMHLEDRCRELHAAFVAQRGALVSLCDDVEGAFARRGAATRSS